jgi:hypothetical protein
MTKPTPTIADVIHLAIERYLWDGEVFDEDKTHSCDAVYYALLDLVQNRDEFPFHRNKSMDFIRSLGWRTNVYDSFNEFETDPKRQYARALALTFAEMIAREEGI